MPGSSVLHPSPPTPSQDSTAPHGQQTFGSKKSRNASSSYKLSSFSRVAVFSFVFNFSSYMGKKSLIVTQCLTSCLPTPIDCFIWIRSQSCHSRLLNTLALQPAALISGKPGVADMRCWSLLKAQALGKPEPKNLRPCCLYMSWDLDLHLLKVPGHSTAAGTQWSASADNCKAKPTFPLILSSRAELQLLCIS